MWLLPCALEGAPVKNTKVRINLGNLGFRFVKKTEKKHLQKNASYGF